MTARNTPWNPDDTKVAAAIAQAQRRKPQPVSTDWRKPTGDTQHLVRVGRGELTCLRCGETFGNATPVTGEATRCWRCGGKAGVPTVTYLQPGEYEEAR